MNIPISRHLLLAGLMLALSLNACATAQKDEPETRQPSTVLPGVNYELVEKAHDGEFTLSPDRKEKVDANSDLVLSFHVLKADELAGALAEASPERQRVTALLKKSLELAKSREDLNNLKVDPADPAQVEELQKKVRAHDAQVQALIMNLGELGLSDSESRQILTGAFDGQRNPREPYANLARWLKQQIERLTKEAADVLKAREQFQVTVQAWLDPIRGNRKPLHVEDYDRLPLGELSPIDRYGVKLTPAEREKLAIDIRDSEMWMQVLRETALTGQQLKDSSSRLLAGLRAKLRSFERALADLAPLSEQLKTMQRGLQNLATVPGTSKAVETAAAQSARDLQRFLADVQKVESMVGKVRALRVLLESPAETSLESVLLGPGGVLERLSRVEQEARELWAAANGRLQSILTGLKTLQGTLSGEQFRAVFSQEAEGVLHSVAEEISSIVGSVQVDVSLLAGNLPIAEGADTLSKTQVEPIPRDLDDLPPGRVELQRSGLTLGDQVSINVRFKEKDKSRSAEARTYTTEAVLMGLHRVIAADVIFARGFGSQESRKWKPNVAARADWHYRVRAPESNVEKGWNIVDPGLGLHVASLDQGADSVEFGMGANLSFWGGFVVVGYGHNLSTDRQYVFVGLNLLDVLNKTIRQ